MEAAGNVQALRPVRSAAPAGRAGRLFHVPLVQKRAGCCPGSAALSRAPTAVAAATAVTVSSSITAKGSPASTPATSGKTKGKHAASSVALVAEHESLQLLEWPALCRQVACFAQTPLGAEVAVRGELAIGRSQQESERLLQQTAEAQQAQLSFKGVFDIRRALDAVDQGQVLHPLVLGAIATTLGAAQQLEQQLAAAAAEGQAAPRYACLTELAAGIQGALPQLQAAIRECIQVDDGRLLDSASAELAGVRQARRANLAELRRQMDQWARQLHAKGVSERPQVVVRRDRLCVPVRQGRQGELPRGSVTLATSASGSTAYIEPQPTVALNNAEMALAGRERDEEERILIALTSQVAAALPSIRRTLAAITTLDLASARARHATWLGAARPRFLSPAEAAEGGAVQLPRARHPLLLQPSLPPPPMPPLTEDQQQQADLAGNMAALALVPELAPAASPKPSTAAEGGGAGGSGGWERVPPPQAVDLTVPPGVRVVAVTGPNTGGKTASLKTLGLSALMAKAGLFLPRAPPAEERASRPAAARSEASSSSSSSNSSSGATCPPPALLWPDLVLADLGDGQSLQQSLSTFSGHVQRIRGILAAATPQSLVLLDEVGSGTDPEEGAALAAALLERLRGAVALTYATSHHAQLKELAAFAPGYINACVEFDTATLRPTYRLLWGSAGESNALAVAQGLGFSAAVVAEARQVAAALREQQAAPDRAQALQASLLEQVEEARQAAAAAAAARAAAEAETEAAQREQQRLETRSAAAAKGAAQARALGDEARARLQKLLADVRGGRLVPREAEEQLRHMEAAAAAPPGTASIVASGEEGGGMAHLASLKDWVPQAGEAVRVLKMGGAVGTVVAAAAGGGRGGSSKISVRVGSLTVELRLSDLAPSADGPSASSSGAGRRATGSAGASGSKAAAGGARQQLRALGTLSGGSGVTTTSGGVSMQTSFNTVDVRGRSADEAEGEVAAAVAAAPAGWIMFVVHGVGTGRVRKAVLALLRQHPRVQRVEEQEGSQGGCSVATIR